MDNVTKVTAVTAIEGQEEKAIQTVQAQEVASVESFIVKAIENNLPVETMERLFALREKVKAEKAREAFTEAMAAFQAECPVIEKTKPVYEKGSQTVVRYRFAPLDVIVEQVKEPLGRNGLSYSFDEVKDDASIAAVCKITHRLGHSETSSFKIPIGTEAYMSDPQKHGARMTFAKRYAFCNALGILTGDEDTDAKDEGKDEKPKALPADKLEQYEISLKTATDLDELRKIWAALPGEARSSAELAKVKETLKAQYASK